jgi:hypothetical protein
VDESTRDKDAAHSAVCVCKSDIFVTEELLELIPFHGTAGGEYIFVREITIKI